MTRYLIGLHRHQGNPDAEQVFRKHPLCPGQALLRGAIHEEFSGNFFTPSPVVVIHPMEMVDGGLSEVEERLFRELAAGAGARNVFVHVGPALSGDTAIALGRPLTEDLNGRGSRMMPLTRVGMAGDSRR